MRLRFPIAAKLTLLTVALVILTAFAVNEVYLRGSNQILTERAIHDLEQEAEFFQYPLSGVIKQLQDDVQLVSQLSATRGLMRARLHGGVDPLDRSTEAQLKTRLSTTFEEMLRTREHYRRIRYVGISDAGKEILRVERFGNQIERTAESKLLHSGNESHIQEATRLAPGDVYLSEISLSRDNGQLTLPHMLVLRAVVPIYTQEKEIFGVVVINADFGSVLADIRRHLLGLRSLYVTNTAGDYLIHPDPTYLYAGDLGHDRRIQRDYPKLTEVMGSPKQEKITFVPEDMKDGNVYAFHKFHYDPLNQDHYIGIAVEAPYAQILSKTKEVERQGFIFSLAIAVLAALSAVYFLRLLMRPLNRVADAVVRYRRGEKGIALPVESPDEIGVLAREFKDMMTQKDAEEWVKENLVGISKDLLGFKELQLFANSLMASVTPALNAQVGVLYISSTYAAHRQSNRENEALTFLGAYGYAEQGTLPTAFRWGEGLVGQCAKDRKARLVSDIPENYLRITSALGEARPKFVLLQPILFENTLAGVMEIASLNGFTEIQRDFLEQLGFNVGVIINSISAGQRTEELLEETRQVAEELQRSEEELKTQQEELEASNEELEEKTGALEKQNAQIRRQSEDLEQSKQLVEEKARELELANKYKSEFLANMSHELRTPLNSLLILARSLASNEEKNLTEEQVEEARIIHNGGLELLNLINDILDLSKVEAGKLTIVAEDALLQDTVRKLQQQFDPVAGEKGIAFHIQSEEGVPDALHTDAQRMEQILKNLLSNAFKFTEKGSVTLKIYRPGKSVELQRASLEHGKAIAFSVIDTGIGIETAKLKDIFEAFQQEDGSTDRHYGGTGLGLTIARKFAHMLGGEIHVVSEKGRGSVFTLVLPLTLAVADLQKPANVAMSVPAESRTQLKVMTKAQMPEFIADDRKAINGRDRVLLIIEDDKNFAATLMHMARARGYKCLAAGDGKSGLLLALEQPVHAVILDLKLPDMDGMQVLDQLKNDLHSRHIPVHIITGRDPENNVVSLRKGAIGYLTKPVAKEGIEEAFTRIEKMLQSEMKQVLVVEDDKKSQVAIQSLLKQKNIHITVSGTGQGALECLRGTRFDCVILDLRLPDMTGFEWLEKMEGEFSEGVLPPVIIYTAKDLSEEENRRLGRYTGNIIIKGAKSPERLLDEATLFLHSVESALSKDQQEMIRMQHDPGKVLQGRTVLLVDDDLRNTFALSKLLRKQGMNVVIADNGQLALEKLKETPSVEAVIMDIMMPVMDGYQAIQEIRTQKSYSNLPIIALTARAMPEEQEKCMAAGANDYLTKPVDVERLLTLLRVWLFRQEVAA
jgi:CheY-like chemotaxis protein/signal transduction histidine kinase